jgi:superfamily II DNA or RNA helicase
MAQLNPSPSFTPCSNVFSGRTGMPPNPFKAVALLSPSSTRYLGFRFAFRAGGPILLSPCRIDANGAVELLPERVLTDPPAFADAAARACLGELESFARAKHFSVPEDDFLTLLPVIRTAHLFVHHPSRAVTWPEAPHRIHLRTQGAEHGLALSARITDADGSDVHIDPRARLFPCGQRTWLFDGHDAMLPLAHGYQGWMEEVLPGPLRFDASSIGRWTDDLYPSILRTFSVEVDDPHTPRIVAVTPVPVLRLSEKNEDLVVVPCFQYPPSAELVTATRRDWVADGNVRYRRDHSAEVEHTTRLRALIPTAPPDLEGRYYLRGADALRFLDRDLSGLGEQWRVQVDEPLRLYRKSPSQPVLHARIASATDCFDLKVEIESVGRRYDAWKLLAVTDDAAEYIKTPHGFVKLPTDVLHRLREHMAEIHEGRAHRTQIERLKLFVSDFPDTETDEGWRVATQKGALVWPPPPLDPPADLQATLRPYQQEGFQWLAWLAEQGLGGILADDMGLGKTLQTIALLLHLRAKAKGDAEFGHLIVVPSSLVFNWETEIKRFAPSLRVWKWIGDERANQLHLLRQADVVITNYTILRNDAAVFERRRWQSVILDEAQSIKNAQSQTADSARRIPADFRLALSGTPVENHPSELWSYFQFLMPGFFGSLPSFERTYLSGTQTAQKQGRERLRKRISPFLLRRMKDDVAKELPPKTELVVACEMSPAQRKLYETLRAQAKSALQNQDGLHVLQSLMKLRQACCDPRLIGKKHTEEDSGKLAILVELLENAAAEGHKVLVFSQFTSMLDIIEAALPARSIDYARLDGTTKDRGAPVKRFQTDPACKVFLISLRSGGTGLNLTAADYVVHYDPWWNPAVEDQATDRAHRLGQDKPVFVYKLIARGTLEERILALQEKKRTWADELLADGYPFASLTLDELRELI